MERPGKGAPSAGPGVGRSAAMSSSVSSSRLLAVALLAALAGAAPSAAQPVAGKKYAVLVGVKTYNHARLPDLRFTGNDVTELAGLLRPAGYDVTLLTDTQGQKPTADNIRAALT